MYLNNEITPKPLYQSLFLKKKFSIQLEFVELVLLYPIHTVLFLKEKL